MGSTICTAGFPSPAIASSRFTARCASIWYGFFIATLLFSAKRKLLSAYQKASSGESLLSTIYRTFPPWETCKKKAGEHRIVAAEYPLQIEIRAGDSGARRPEIGKRERNPGYQLLDLYIAFRSKT